ncbi:MAG: F0F1 ATP synthase subunit epsilon [Actinobacteria bacterium]|nr:F0F1 ATP synthase subunit epsilon [Actinomycetota bacterium]
MTLQVQIVSPERVLWAGEAEMVTTRVVEGGDITFLTGHVPYLGSLNVGLLTVRPAEGDDVTFAVHGGFVEVSDDTVSVLSDVAELPETIDVARAQLALERAEKAEKDDPSDTEATEARRRAELRLAVAQGDTAAAH